MATIGTLSGNVATAASDLSFFLIAYSLAFVAGFLGSPAMNFVTVTVAVVWTTPGVDVSIAEPIQAVEAMSARADGSALILNIFRTHFWISLSRCATRKPGA